MPWSELIRFGLGVLRLPPDAFWSLSVAELVCLLAASGGAGEALSRAEFANLILAFPDF
jgi:uncharacterized phage protein (TIGR02216 family)